MNTTDDRAVRALMDVVGVEEVDPGLMRVTTWSDEYFVDARGEGCTCPDKEYHLEPGEHCKHHVAAILATRDDLPTPFQTGDLRTRAVTDGGTQTELVDDADANDERPDDCDCADLSADRLPCFPCFEAGFTTVADR